MTIERMIELLEIEHECMLRSAHDDCNRKCADCELVQEDAELHEMYTNVVWLLKEQEPVRCKDCAYALFKEGLVQHGHIVCTKPFTERWQVVKPDNWFCGDWKRKEVKE